MKKKLLILAPYPHDCAPSQRFRFEQYLPYFKEELDVRFESFIDLTTWKKLYEPGRIGFKAFKMFQSFARRILLLPAIMRSDFILVHREMAQIGPPVLEWIVAKVLRKKFIYDFDDAIWIPNYSETNKTFQRIKAYWKVRYLMKWAHHVMAGNEYLADFARVYNKKVTVVPTTIDTNYHKENKSESSPLIIGWTGSHTTMHYLAALEPVLKKLSEKFEFQFRVISNQPPEFPLTNLEFIKWSGDREIEDLSAISIGVMTLIEDKWAAGKCGFKALQYMSIGIPAVVSPVGVNKTIIQDGVNGFFASSEEEWLMILEKLIKEQDLRSQVGRAAIDSIEKNFSVNAHKKTYIDIITS